LDLAGHLTAHLHCDDGVHRPGGRDGGGQRASLYHGRTVLRDATASLGLKVPPDADTDDEADEERPACTPYHHGSDSFAAPRPVQRPEPTSCAPATAAVGAPTTTAII